MNPLAPLQSTNVEALSSGMTTASEVSTAALAAVLASKPDGATKDDLASMLGTDGGAGAVSKEEVARQDKLARTIYVGNLNPMIQVDHLKEFFSVCGAVNLVKIAGNSTNPQAARYGFVEFETTEPAHAAYNLSGHFLLDRPIKIGPARNAILNPHPSSKSAPATNPVKINHAMAKVRLLQKRIANRHKESEVAAGSGAAGSGGGTVDAVGVKEGDHRDGDRKRKRSGTRSRSRSRSRSRRDGRYRNHGDDGRDGRDGYYDGDRGRDRGGRRYDDRGHDRHRDRRRYRDREMGERERDRDYDRRRDRLERKKRRKREKEERQKERGNGDGDGAGTAESAKDEVWCMVHRLCTVQCIASILLLYDWWTMHCAVCGLCIFCIFDCELHNDFVFEPNGSPQ